MKKDWDTTFGKVSLRGAMIDTDGTNLVEGVEIKVEGKLVAEVLNMTFGQVEDFTQKEVEKFVEENCDICELM
jgi:coenzyme F420-reducing hydrogenase beta subunit